MSSNGQIIGGIVGAVVGYFVGNPVLGAQVGMTLGGLIDPPKVLGPRLDDLSTQTSSYGVFIPRLYGTVAVSGNLFWIQGNALIEREVDEGGKGGPTVTNFDYFASFAVGLCEGPIDGVRRVWIGGQLWYDAGSDDLSTIVASNEAASTFTLYAGTDTQLADPLIQADRGAVNVPAYRGLAYLVFDELPLKDYGNSLAAAQVKVEVVMSGSLSAWQQIVNTDTGVTFTRYSPSVPGAGTPFITGYSYGVITVGIVGSVSSYKFTIDGESLGVGVAEKPALANVGSYYAGGKMNGQHVWIRDIEPSVGVALCYDLDTSPAGSGQRIDQNLPQDRKVIGASVSNDGMMIFVFCGDVGVASTAPNTAAVWYVLDDAGEVIDNGTVGFSADFYSLGTSRGATNGHFGAMSFDQDTMTLATVYGAGLGYSHFLSYGADKVLSSTQLDPISDNAFTKPTVLLYGEMIFVFTFNDFNLYLPPTRITPTTVPLSTIVQSECLKSDLLTAADLDVTDLTDQVRGYRVSSLAPLRGGIDPLRKAWPFDAIQHGYKIKFKRRGGASVATITEGELDARAAGTTPGVQIANTREMDLVLPKQLTAQYLDATREYDVNVAEESRQ